MKIALNKLFTLSLFLLLPLSFSVAAEDPLTLNIEPSVFLINLKQGEAWSSSIRVNNSGEVRRSYEIFLADFQMDENGDYVPVLATLRRVGDTRSANTPIGLSDWIRPNLSSLSVEGGSDDLLHFKIDIPVNAKPGEYRAGILVGPMLDSDTKSGASVSVSTLISSVFSVRVTGVGSKELRIKSFASSKMFYGNPDITLILELENLGHVPATPEGAIEISDFLGNKVGNMLLTRRIMSGLRPEGGSETYILNWKPARTIFGLGPYLASVNLSYQGEGGLENISSSSIFWIVPFRMAVSLAVGLFVFMFVFERLFRIYLRKL